MFTIKMIPKDKPFTRRGILSVTSSIYNPLTMVSPITLQAEKLLQDLCKQGLIWDEGIRRDKSQFWRTNQTLQEEFQLKFDKAVFWSDSTVPLQYIKNEDKRFYTFVANRLVVI